MTQQPKKTQPRKLTGTQFALRYKAEKSLLQQRYCVAFAFWRGCGQGRCRREHACRGDAFTCLKRALPAVPHAAQWQTRQMILAATPKNIGAPERAARQCMPADFYIETTAQAVADYLAKFKPGPRLGSA